MLDALGVIGHLAPHEAPALEGDDAGSFHRVVSGVIAAYKATADGRRQILAFYFPGDPVCLSTAGTIYDYSAEAVGHASVCSVSRTRVREYTKRTPTLRDGLLDAVRREMAAAARGAPVGRTQDGARAARLLPAGVCQSHRSAGNGRAGKPCRCR